MIFAVCLELHGTEKWEKELWKRVVLVRTTDCNKGKGVEDSIVWSGLSCVLILSVSRNIDLKCMWIVETGKPKYKVDIKGGWEKMAVSVV